jgi:hypothetical protein
MVASLSLGRVERMRPRVGLLGDAAVEDTEHIAGVDQGLRSRHALRLAGLVVVDLIGGGNVDTVGPCLPPLVRQKKFIYLCRPT